MTAAFQSLRQQAFWSSCLWLFGLYATALIVNGLAVTDIPDFLTISQDTTKLLNPIDRQIFYSSPLNYFIADLFHLNSVGGFYLIHGIEIVAMLICAAAAVGKKLPAPEQKFLYIILLGLTPLWLVSFKWFGKTDPVLIGGFFLLWGFQGPWRILVMVVMIIAHRELGSLMSLSLFFLEGRKDKHLLYALVAGNGFHLLYQYGILDQVPSSRAALMAGKTKIFLAAFGQMPALYIMSMFSWYWIFLCLEKPHKTEAILFGIAFVLALMNEDFTRDFTLAALPATVFHIERVARSNRFAQMRKLWPLTLMHFQIAALGHFYAANNSFIYLFWH